MKIKHKKVILAAAFIILTLTIGVTYKYYDTKPGKTEKPVVNIVVENTYSEDLSNESTVQAAPKEGEKPAKAEPVSSAKVKLGDDLITNKYKHLISGKRIGIITNQTGVNSSGQGIIDVIKNFREAKLTALYAPEHGIDGKAPAGQYVKSYTHKELNIPVYSLYGSTRVPTADMLSNIDVLLFDIQDVGLRYYTYISTLNNCMTAAAKYGKTVIVLDRPNPIGNKVEGPVLEDAFKSFVGIDNLPVCHGMTVGELANFFNRKIGVNLCVVPMEGYNRNMIFQDTGLKWIPTSPRIQDLDSLFQYGATGIGEGTEVVEKENFKWVGGPNIDSNKFAAMLNAAGLPGVAFTAEDKEGLGGVRLKVTDCYSFNPTKTGIYILSYAYSLSKFKFPDEQMFNKIMGTNKMGEYIKSGLAPEQIIERYGQQLEQFKQERKKYLIYN